MPTEEEKKAFEVLCEADMGTGYNSRCFWSSLTTYDTLSYSAYISGFNGPEFYGWIYGDNPMETVINCIAKAKEVIEENRLKIEAEQDVINP